MSNKNTYKNFETRAKKLTNFKILEKQDSKDNTYIIFDNDNQDGNNAYFYWRESVKTGLPDLIKNKS